MLDELPRSELAKLDGPATIDGDSLQVSVHNGTSWELREVVIGLTIIRRPEPGDAASYYGPARIVPAVADASSHPVQDSVQKQPDVTLLLRVKGSAAPSATAHLSHPTELCPLSRPGMALGDREGQREFRRRLPLKRTRCNPTRPSPASSCTPATGPAKLALRLRLRPIRMLPFTNWTANLACAAMLNHAC